MPPSAAEVPPNDIPADATPVTTTLMVPGHYLYPGEVMLQAPDKTFVRVQALKCECGEVFPNEPAIPLARLHLLEHALGGLLETLFGGAAPAAPTDEAAA